MTKYYKFTREELKKLLVDAYEAGWSGPLDLNDSYADGLIADELGGKIEVPTQMELPFTTDMGNINVVDRNGEPVPMPGSTITVGPYSNENIDVELTSWDLNYG